MAGWSAAVLDPAVNATACPSGSESDHVSMVATEKTVLPVLGGPCTTVTWCCMVAARARVA
eukprot:5623080-Pyramimonas_sp.AAC.1